MRTIPQNLAAHLADGVTTLCHCWKLIRRDGVIFGFTDHDRDLAFGGTTFAARSGLEAAEASAELGFAVGGGEVAGALVSAGLSEDDIASGLYDDASVETWLVNWSNPAERVLLDIGSIGEIRRADGSFVAEVRGLMHRFDEERGRLFRATCSADLGDEACGVDLASPSYSDMGTVTRTDGSLTIAASGIGFADGWCTAGRLTWTSGDNAGISVEIKTHRAVGGADEFDLWQRAPQAIKAGDRFRITAGCDKTHATCRAKFGNAVNFRGFPHMPGNDFIIRMPQQGEAGLDGGSFFT
ncbi:putative phage protein (TIGR02218 family) [Microvirga flocculans]|uniref:Putative phage protein (TIGR02218 family) n=1 Tax=Microvirga flocculans TaxID=217168 RepID=A0A7W6N969_9HYPH|nr:DUF2163 domain-containing protein [Microvirga flocculans]MBB4041401.1 putative phage protein (TIGR02218 family) [Microvirga flocculans]